MAEHKIDAQISSQQAREPMAQKIPFPNDEVESLMQNARLTAYFSKDKLISLCNRLKDRNTEQMAFYPRIDAGELGLYAGVYYALESVVEVQDQIHFQSEEVKEHLTQIRRRNEWLFRKVRFNVADIESLLEHADGIYFLTSAITFQQESGPQDFHTLTAIPRAETPSSGISSLLPCPPNCGGDDPYERFEVERPE